MRQSLGVAAALLLTGPLLGLAAAQPVVAKQRTVIGRSDAEVYLVVDVSLSMGARASSHGPTRLDRARAFATRLRAELPGIPVGLASLSDRLLPHLFPTPSFNSFVATLNRSLGVGRPPTQLSWQNSLGTKLDALANLGTSGFFSPQARHRYTVVLTDGETLPTGGRALGMALRSGRVGIAFARFWRPSEHVYLAGGRIDPVYLPNTRSSRSFPLLAERLGARVFAEDGASSAGTSVRAALGRGKQAARGRELQSFELGPFTAAAAMLPLLYVLLRRNVPPGAGRRLLLRAGRDDRLARPTPTA